MEKDETLSFPGSTERKKKKLKLDSFPASYQFFLFCLQIVPASPNPGEEHTQKPITSFENVSMYATEITTLPRTGFMRAGYCLCPHGN